MWKYESFHDQEELVKFLNDNNVLPEDLKIVDWNSYTILWYD